MKKIPTLARLFLAIIFIVSCKTEQRLNCDGENEIIHKAFDEKDQEAVLASIARGANVNARCMLHNNLDPLLYRAAELGYYEVVKALLEGGAKVADHDKGFKSPLYMAVQGGYADIVELLLKNDANVDKSDEYRSTPLHIAAQNGYVEICSMLLKYGASLETGNKEWSTPLHWATDNGHIEVVKFLLENKAVIDKKNRRGYTPLMLAIRSYSAKGQVALLKLLIDTPQDLNLEDHNGQTALNMAEQRSKAARSEKNNADEAFYKKIVTMLKKKLSAK